MISKITRNIKKVINLIKKDGIIIAFKRIKGTLDRRKNEQDLNIKYQEYIKKNEPTIEELEKQKNTKFNYEPKISIVVPMYNTPYNFFKELVDSIINQTYSNWELCLADGSPEKNIEIEKICKKDKRIKYKFLNKNKGIAENTNEAISMAEGEYIALLDHDDLLPLFSLYEVVKCINENDGVEFIYSDEDKITSLDNPRFDPHFKPDFSIDFLRSNNYICHLSVFKKELMDKLKGERSIYDGAQDFDLILRMAEETKNIVHIPRVLYHWRVHPNSTSQSDVDSKPYAFEAGTRAIQDHLNRLNINAKAEYGEGLGTYRVNYNVIGNPKVSIIIPNKFGNKSLNKCVKSILKQNTYNNFEILVIKNCCDNSSSYSNLSKNDKIIILEYPEKEYNYSKMINYGIKKCSGDYIVQLNSSIKIITKSWIENMLGFAQREDIALVGCKLYNLNNKIEHAGMVLTKEKVIEIFKGLPRYAHGYFARESSIQNFSCISYDLRMCRKSTFDNVKYTDEYLNEQLNDLDFCLKLREMGKNIVYNPFVEAIYSEQKEEHIIQDDEKEKFIKKWEKFYKKGDPYFNKNFKQNSNYYEIK